MNTPNESLEEIQTPKPPTLLAVIIMFTFFAVVIFLLYEGIHFIFSNNPLDSISSPEPVATPVAAGHTDVEAYIDAQAIVKKTLKAPSTAKFPSSSYATIEHAKDNGFKVSSYVDSQNSFGAMIRSDWSVLFQYTPDEKVDVWLVVVDGQQVYRKPGV